MTLTLFIALNAVLLIRPEDLSPELAGARLYLMMIGLNLAAALPRLVNLLRPAELARRPITLCVLGLLGMTALSHLVHARIDEAGDVASEFAKVVAYYLLLIAVVDTPARLRAFLGWLVAFVAVLAVLGLFQFHGVIDHEALRPVEQKEYDAATGEIAAFPRLCSAGIFNDPNDLCLILTVGMVGCLYHAGTANNVFISAIWLAPCALFGYATYLTKSRGGLIGLLSAVAAFLVGRYGWRRALPLLIVGLPITFAAVGGRQSNINLGTDDTARSRVMLWAEGLHELSRSPRSWFTGIGAGRYADVVGLEAHNSFVQAYVELGLIGGTLFLTAFALAARALHRVSRADRTRILAPFVLAMIVGYSAGMYSLSRNYIVPTYLCLGVAETYLLLAMPDAPEEFRVTRRWVIQTVVLGIGGLVFLKFFTQGIGLLSA